MKDRVMKKEEKFWIIISLIILIVLSLIVLGGITYFLLQPHKMYDTGIIRGGLLKTEIKNEKG